MRAWRAANLIAKPEFFEAWLTFFIVRASKHACVCTDLGNILMKSPLPFLLLAFTLALGLSARASDESPSVFKLEPYRKSVALRAVVGGQPGFFTFDTAGGISILDPKFAERIGCKPWGRLSGYQMLGKRLDSPHCDDVPVTLGKITLKASSAGIGDVAKLFAADAEPVDGMLALDIFAGRAITIDFPARELTIETSASLSARTARMTPVPMRISRELQGRALAVSAGVKTASGTMWMEMDSGNGGTVLVSQPLAALLGLDGKKEGPQRASFALAGDLRVETDHAFTPDLIIDGNIGMPFLKDVAVTMDLANEKMWITRTRK